MTREEDLPPFLPQAIYDARQVDNYVSWLQGRLTAYERENRKLKEGKSPQPTPIVTAPDSLGFHVVLDCPPDVDQKLLDGMMSDLLSLLKVALFNAALVSDFPTPVPRSSMGGPRQQPSKLELRRSGRWNIQGSPSKIWITPRLVWVYLGR